MSRIKVGVIAVGFVVACTGTIYGSLYLGKSLSKDTSSKKQACASGQHSSHNATIQGSIVTPSNTVAPRCDTLIITNLDDKPRLIAFGLHEEHEPYDGVEEKLLSKGQSLTVTLIDAGNFRFHDHIEDQVQGTFTVN